MQRFLASKLSSHFFHHASNSRNWNAGLEVGFSARSFSYYFSTGLGRVPKGDFKQTVQDQFNSRTTKFSKNIPSADIYANSEEKRNRQIGENVSRKDKMKFLINTLSDLKDSKEAVYGTLDAWVAWEQKFPMVSLKRALRVLEKDNQWHRVIQVIKWMLSKGQGTTLGTYEQLIRALDKDQRAEEAHEFWVKKIGDDLHSVPWNFCSLMISIYYRNNMLERLVKLFKTIEAFDRNPPEKSIVQKVADAYEMLGLLEDKKRVLEKYSYLSAESHVERRKKSRRTSIKTKLKEKRKQKAQAVHGQTPQNSPDSK